MPPHVFDRRFGRSGGTFNRECGRNRRASLVRVNLHFAINWRTRSRMPLIPTPVPVTGPRLTVPESFPCLDPRPERDGIRERITRMDAVFPPECR